MITQIRHTETVDGARARLARKARQQGVSLRIDARGNWFANSVSTPGREYFVTAVSCQCTGFVNRQRCIHNSAVLVALGLLDVEDDDPEPTPPVAAVAVIHIAGHWITGGWLVCDGCPVWQPSVTEITIDGNDVLRVVGDQFDVRVHWLEDGHAVDNMTSATPSGMTHRAAAEHWLRSLAASAPVDALLYGAGVPEDRDLWDDLPDVAADDVDNSLEEVA